MREKDGTRERMTYIQRELNNQRTHEGKEKRKEETTTERERKTELMNE